MQGEHSNEEKLTLEARIKELTQHLEERQQGMLPWRFPWEESCNWPLDWRFLCIKQEFAVLTRIEAWPALLLSHISSFERQVLRYLENNPAWPYPTLDLSSLTKDSDLYVTARGYPNTHTGQHCVSYKLDYSGSYSAPTAHQLGRSASSHSGSGQNAEKARKPGANQAGEGSPLHLSCTEYNLC